MPPEESQAAEQPGGDSGAAGLYMNADDAAEALVEMGYDDAEEGADTSIPDKDGDTLDDTEEQDPTERAEESDELDEESDEDQPDEDSDDQPDATDDEIELPSDDLVIAADGETKVTLGELRERFQKSETERSELEAEFTKKSQQVAESVKKAEEQTEQALSHYQVLMQGLGQGIQQLDATTDWAELEKSSPGEFQTKLNQRNQMKAQLEQIGKGAEELLAQAQNAKKDREAAEAKSAIDYLTNRINGWNQDAYNKVAKFAESRGMPADAFKALRSGPAIEMMHDLMRVEEAKAAALKKVRGKSQQETPQKGKKRQAGNTLAKKIANLEKRARKGDTDAALDLLMLRPRD